jgi:group II intron reverse transcriptase/maturase
MGKEVTKIRSPQRKHVPDMKDWKKDMPTSLRGITNRARRDKKARFGSLYGLLNENNLRWCFRQLRKTSAAGVDRITYAEYERDLENNLSLLVEKLKQKRYRAKLVRRKHIPKGEGKTRALGIPALEDKLLQLACAKVLDAIHEEDFMEFSWGYRKGRGGREASRKLANDLHGGRYGWVVEADIKGFFDHLDHDWMLKMLERRVKDRAFLHLIRKWMKAGILEESGEIRHPATGTPQGGIISPVLANVYLHYVLDLWFEYGVKKGCHGQVTIMRYADDFVCAFQYKADAERFMWELPERLKKFNLEVAEDKTRMLPFSSFREEPNEAFEFLGFEFRWVRRRSGKMGVQRRTSPKKLGKSVSAFKEWIMDFRHNRMENIMKALNQKLRGYWNYYGVRGNFKSLSKLYYKVNRLLFKWLNRRSHKRSYTWKGYNVMCQQYGICAPHIVEKPYQPDLFK